MTNADYDTSYRCAVCRVWYVVPTLARDCEDKHRGDSREVR